MNKFNVEETGNGPVATVESPLAFMAILFPVSETETRRIKIALQFALQQKYLDIDNELVDYCHWNKREVGIILIPIDGITNVDHKKVIDTMIDTVQSSTGTQYEYLHLDALSGQLYVYGNSISDVISVSEDDNCPEKIYVDMVYNEENIKLLYATMPEIKVATGDEEVGNKSNS